jgi:hypothetical protein
MPNWGKLEWLKSGLIWAGRRLHSILALVAAVVAVVGTEAGWFEGTKELAVVTLGVLTVVALALLIERGLPLSIRDELREMRGVLDRTRGDVGTLQTGSAYHVLRDESEWDITSGGDESQTKRTRLLRFTQDQVITLLDWARGDGTGNSTYSCGEPLKDFKLDGRHYRLLLLERFYNRGDELEFTVRRTSKGMFPKKTDRVTIEALHVISVLKMTVRWPVERPPTAVRFRKTSAAGTHQTEAVTDAVRLRDGRREYSVTAHAPELGSLTVVEWDW